MRKVISAEKHDTTQHDNKGSSKDVESFSEVVRELSHLEGEDQGGYEV